jgi:hypothetical protein
MKRLSVYCTTLRALALTTPPTTLESLDAGLKPNWRRQKRSCRSESAFLYISSFKKFDCRCHAFCGASQLPRFERSCRISLTVWASYSFIASGYYVRITSCQGSNSRYKKEDISFSDRLLQLPAIFLFSNRPYLITCSLVVWGFPNLCQHITHQEGIPHRIDSRIYANIKEN